jgi:hypothetical protein
MCESDFLAENNATKMSCAAKANVGTGTMMTAGSAALPAIK